MPSNKRGFDFSTTTTSLAKNQETPFMFGSNQEVAGSSQAIPTCSTAGTLDSITNNPFVFGDLDRPVSPQKIPRKEKHKESKLNILPKWLKGDDSKQIEKDQTNR